MPEFIADPSQSLYLILAVLAVIGLAMWARSRKRSDLVVFLIVLGVLALVVVGDLAVEGPREEVRRKTEAVAAAIKAKRPEDLTQYVAGSFKYGGVDRDGVKDAADKAIRAYGLSEVVVWDFAREPVKRDDKTYVQRFRVKPKADRMMDNPGFVCDATWVKEADGQYRLQTFELSFPTGEKFHIPGM
jgi:hypothetical protein